MDNDNDIINFDVISVEALSCDTIQKLSGMLNRQKVLLSPKPTQRPRDYRGLGDLMGVENVTKEWSLNDDYVPMLLSSWRKLKRSEANLGKLREFFGLIDRFDVLDDTQEMFVKDARDYKYRQALCEEDPPGGFYPDYILTRHDVKRFQEGLPPQIYDALILYDFADETFANLIITELEGQFNLMLCVVDRDLLSGRIERTAIFKIISKRCRSVIVIYSCEFLQSQNLTDYVQLAQAINGKRIIPCIDKDYPKQDENLLNLCHILDYRRSKTGLFNFWDKLHSSLVPLVQEKNNNPTPNVQTEMDLPPDEPEALPSTSSTLPTTSSTLPTTSSTLPSLPDECQSNTSSRVNLFKRIRKNWKKSKPKKVACQ